MSETNLIPNDNFEVEAEPIPTPVMTVNSEKPDDKGNVDVEGGGGTSNYERLTNRPKINGNTLSGDQTAEDLGLADPDDIDDLQSQIDAITSSTDVRDVVADHAALEDYDTSVLFDNDIVKVLEDETHSNAVAYYRWVIIEGEGSWSYIGVLGSFYTKSETDAMFSGKQSTINDLSDIRSGAEKGATSVQTVNGEEPDQNGNVNVSGGSGSYVPAEYHTANVKWGDFVTDTIDVGQTLYINIDESMPNNNLVIRAFVTSYVDNDDPVYITPFSSEYVKWANDTAPTFRAGHVYEIVISHAPFYLLCSWSEFTEA